MGVFAFRRDSLIRPFASSILSRICCILWLQASRGSSDHRSQDSAVPAWRPCRARTLFPWAAGLRSPGCRRLSVAPLAIIKRRHEPPFVFVKSFAVLPFQPAAPPVPQGRSLGP